MARPIDIKKRLKIVGQHQFPAIVTDIIRIADTLILDEEPGSEEDYGRIAGRILILLKKYYREQLVVDTIISKQQDLEVLIENLKTGVEPVWTNKSSTTNAKDG